MPALDLTTDPPPPRLGLVREALQHATPRMRQHVAERAAQFEAAGARVEEVSLGEPLDLILAVHHVIMQTEAATAHWQLLEQYPGSHQPRLRAYVEVGRLLPGVAYLHAQRLRRRIRAAMARSLAGVDALLLPTAGDVAPTRETTGDTSLQAPFSLAGFPSLSLPSGVSEPDGLPMAIQLVSGAWQEARLLASGGGARRSCRACPRRRASAVSDVDRLAGLLREAGAAGTVVFTGAGVSTESGIPDFRSPGGIWTRYAPIDYADYMRDPGMRREAWRRGVHTYATMVDAQPNAAHLRHRRLVACRAGQRRRDPEHRRPAPARRLA